MRPPFNRHQQICSSLLRKAGSTIPGLRVLLHAALPTEKNMDLLARIPPPFLEDPEQLRQLAGMPAHTLLVLEADAIPPDLLPPPAPLELSIALLACSGSLLYDPRRPVVLTHARLHRRIVLLQPHRYHAF
jgi:hypothetical protein